MKRDSVLSVGKSCVLFEVGPESRQDVDRFSVDIGYEEQEKREREPRIKDKEKRKTKWIEGKEEQEG